MTALPSGYANVADDAADAAAGRENACALPPYLVELGRPHDGAGDPSKSPIDTKILACGIQEDEQPGETPRVRRDHLDPAIIEIQKLGGARPMLVQEGPPVPDVQK